MEKNKKALKAILHESIDNTDDVDILQKVKYILEQKEPEIPISSETRKHLDEAKKQVREGKVYTHEEANRMFEEWKKK